MSDWKPTKMENPNFKCRECGSNEIQYCIVEDDDCHEDLHYHCSGCGRMWWAEGIDS